MPNLGPTELIIIGVVLVLLFGATRLPQTAKGLGQALRIFKKEIREEDKPEQEMSAAASPQTINSTATPADTTNTQQASGPQAASTQPAENSNRASS
jgi:sec-independent protein translocase protein TatA